MGKENKKRIVVKRYSGALKEQEVSQYLMRLFLEKKQEQGYDKE